MAFEIPVNQIPSLWESIGEPSLISPYRGKTNIKALLQSIAETCQILEDDVFNVLVSTTLEHASAVHLDKWGALVGERRGGLGDPEYRRFILARIQASRCKGSAEEYLRIFRDLTAPSVVEMYPMYPHGFKLYAFRASYMEDVYSRRVGRFMRAIAPAGVEILAAEFRSGYIGFADRDVATTGTEPPLYFDTGVFGREL